MAASTRSGPFPAAAACCRASRAYASAQPMLTSLATSASSCAGHCNPTVSTKEGICRLSCPCTGSNSEPDHPYEKARAAKHFYNEAGSRLTRQRSLLHVS